MKNFLKQNNKFLLYIIYNFAAEETKNTVLTTFTVQWNLSHVLQS